jgi:hypothetical protein
LPFKKLRGKSPPEEYFGYFLPGDELAELGKLFTSFSFCLPLLMLLIVS